MKTWKKPEKKEYFQLNIHFFNQQTHKQETKTEKKTEKTEATPQKQQKTTPFIPNNFIQQKPPSKTEIVAYRTEEKGEEKVNFQINNSFKSTKTAAGFYKNISKSYR